MRFLGWMDRQGRVTQFDIVVKIVENSIVIGLS